MYARWKVAGSMGEHPHPGAVGVVPVQVQPPAFRAGGGSPVTVGERRTDPHRLVAAAHAHQPGHQAAATALREEAAVRTFREGQRSSVGSDEQTAHGSRRTWPRPSRSPHSLKQLPVTSLPAGPRIEVAAVGQAGKALEHVFPREVASTHGP